MFTVNFRTVQPIPFKEYCSDAEFYAEVSGSAEIAFYNETVYGKGEEGENAIREAILAMIPGCFTDWPEGKLIMGPDNREILEELLSGILKATGTHAELSIRSLSLLEGQMDGYMAECREALDRQMNPQVSTDGLKKEEHGPMVDFCLNYSSHGMMAGSSSSSSEELEWNKDGTVTLTSGHSGGGRTVTMKYKVKPEIARKLSDFVAEKNLAGLSKETINTPVMFDCFTSASFSMSFDDSALGGSAYEHFHVECGPAGMTFRTIEKKFSEILDECRETGECILNEENETGGGLFGMLGFAGGMNPQGMLTPVPAQAPSPANLTASPTATFGGAWTCGSCGQTGNSGKFCPNCGNPRNV